jgi:curved DNA-binding protein CbpA
MSGRPPQLPEEHGVPEAGTYAGMDDADKDAKVESEAAIEVYDPEEAMRLQEQLEREQAELNMLKALLGSVFSWRKPRDCFAGTASGLKTVARGFGVGMASVVLLPANGYKTGGAKGLVKGVGAGVGTMLASTAGGVVVGSAQIVRGVAYTPGAIGQKVRGKVWNSETRSWGQNWYSLPEEELEVLRTCKGAAIPGDDEGDHSHSTGGYPATHGGASGSDAKVRSRKRVIDRGLYDILDVEPEANESQIRRAFYKKSLQYHPDKNPDNPEATQKFQAVSEAYRVLGDEDRRKMYDDHGQDPALAGMPKIEPTVFFAALFGSHHFEPYVGRLRLAQEVDGDLQDLLRDASAEGLEDDPTGGLDALKVQRAHEKMKVEQRRREVKCAVDLAALLDTAIASHDAEGDKSLEATVERLYSAEKDQLKKVPCGNEMLYLIGWVYANRARQFFVGSVMQRQIEKIKGKMHMTQSKAKFAGTMGRTAFRVNNVSKKLDKKKPVESNDSRDGKDVTRNEEKADSKGGVCQNDGDEVPASREQSCTSTAAEDHESAEAAAMFAEVDMDTATRILESGQDASDFTPGTTVRVKGLKRKELNDKVAVVIRVDEEKGRYLVELQDGGMEKEEWVKLENLRLWFQAEPDTEGFSGSSPKDSSSKGAPCSSSSATGNGNASSSSADQDGKGVPLGDDAEMVAAFKDCMPLFHDSLWSATSLDIELTLSRVVYKVLRDMSVDKSAHTSRQRRAEALLALGNLFQEPMKKHRRGETASPKEETKPKLQQSHTQDSNLSVNSSSSKWSSSAKSVLVALSPYHLACRRKKFSEAKKHRKKDDVEEKTKRMEMGLALMAAGAKTEDVDDMIAAQRDLEAEFGDVPHH